MNINKYSRYYEGDWPYNESLGVGLSLEGNPMDYREFLDILMEVSCNPIAARRILEVLGRGEKKYVTVMSGLNFNSIGDKLKEVGVVMKMIEPYDYNKSGSILTPEKNDIVDREVLLTILKKDNNVELESELKAIYEERLKEAKRNIEEKPHNFGVYER